MRSLNGIDGITRVNLHIDFTRPPVTLSHGSFFMIANIANRALVSTYISQVTGNHPTSTDLRMAKHIFNPRPTPG